MPCLLRSWTQYFSWTVFVYGRIRRHLFLKRQIRHLLIVVFILNKLYSFPRKRGKIIVCTMAWAVNNYSPRVMKPKDYRS